MRIRLEQIVFIVILIIYLFGCAGPSEKPSKRVTDIDYLYDLYEATYRGISYFVYPDTALPYDVSNFKKVTSISNIGLYMASTAVAGKTGLISEQQAKKEIDKTLTSLEKIQKWHGFPITWVNIETLKREYGTSFSYADHVGNLVCSLLVVASIYPDKFSERIDTFIKPMDFSSTYDKETGWLKGGYNLTKDDFDIKQSWGRWYYNLLASDTRTFSLLGIALGRIPEKHWQELIRDNAPYGKLDSEIIKTIFINKKIDTCPYYIPGMEGGGLFMQCLPSIFISEDDLPVGISAKNFAYCQIEYSKTKGQYPFWGVSACEAPDGKSYIGWGSMKMNVITPHASILAIEYFSQNTLDNLKALERNGVRPKYKDKEGNMYDFGFTDSYDVNSKKASRHYLILDQGMIFLSLANYLYDDVVRESFNSHPLGRRVNELEKHLEREIAPLDITEWNR